MGLIDFPRITRRHYMGFDSDSVAGVTRTSDACHSGLARLTCIRRRGKNGCHDDYQALAPRVSIKRILYLTDFSEPSEAALPFVVSIVRNYGSVVSALHILTPPTIVCSAAECSDEEAASEEEFAQSEMQKLDSQLSGIAHETQAWSGAATFGLRCQRLSRILTPIYSSWEHAGAHELKSLCWDRWWRKFSGNHQSQC